MEDKVMVLKATIAAWLGVLTALWGWFGWLVLIWVGLMLLDFLVGIALAAKNGRWSSKAVREGAWHKGGMVLTVVIALSADALIRMTLAHVPAVDLPFDYTVLIAPLVVVWYIVGELGSLAEHAAATGANVPPWLLGILEAGKKAVDAAGDGLTPGKDDHKNAGK